MAHLAFGLEGQTVLITGGVGGIGRAVCAGFAEAGAKVAVVDLCSDSAAAVAQALGAQHRGFAADLRDIPALGHLVDQVAAALGPVDVLVNGAGVILRNHDLFNVSEADWDAQHDVNLKALFFLTQAVAKRMVDEGRKGAIVNFTSQGFMSGGFGGSVVYNASKGGVTTITRGLARSFAPYGIRVNALSPGLVDTPMLINAQTSAADLEALRQSIPLGRIGVPEDHVGGTVFLASDMARYMTGATLNVSGGFLMY